MIFKCLASAAQHIAVAKQRAERSLKWFAKTQQYSSGSGDEVREL